MHIAMIALMFLLGLYLIIRGGDLFVDAASWIARKSGVPMFLIGATVVSVATTLPEMLVSVFAAIEAKGLLASGHALLASGRMDIAVSNAVGSATANLGLILAISLLCMPATVDGRSFRIKALLLITSSVALSAFGLSGQIGIVPSVLLVTLFIAFLGENALSAKHAPPPRAEDSANVNMEMAKKLSLSYAIHVLARGRETTENVIKFLLGAAGIAKGAQMLVDNGTEIAQALNVPESIIGVTMIAVGTSLPELITTISALKKRVSALSIGNVVGANVIDLTIILPLSALASGMPLTVAKQSRMLDLPACALLSMVAVLPPVLRGVYTGEYRFARAQGALLLALYALYIALVVMGS